MPPRSAAKPIVPGVARAGDAVAAPDSRLVEVDAATFGGGLAEQQGRAGGRVDLHAMMHLDDLDVPLDAERRAVRRTRAARRLTPRLMLPERTIGAWRDGRLEPVEVGGVEARRADDMGDAGLGGQHGEMRRGGRAW